MKVRTIFASMLIVLISGVFFQLSFNSIESWYVENILNKDRKSRVIGDLCYVVAKQCKDVFISANHIGYDCSEYSIHFKVGKAYPKIKFVSTVCDRYSFFKSKNDYSISVNGIHQVEFRSEGLTDAELLKKFVLCSQK